MFDRGLNTPSTDVILFIEGTINTYQIIHWIEKLHSKFK